MYQKLKLAMIDSSNMLIGMETWPAKIAQILQELKEVTGIVLLISVILMIKLYNKMEHAWLVHYIPYQMWQDKDAIKVISISHLLI